MSAEPTLTQEDLLPAGIATDREAAPARELRLRIALGDFERAARSLRDGGARFVTLCAAERPERSVLGVFALRGRLIALRAPVEDVAPWSSIGTWWPAARSAEGELVERSPISPLLRPDPPRAALSGPDADRVERDVEGIDVFALPYGPIRSGVFEAIQFLIETGGEDVPRLHTRIGFKHRGLEERMRGMDVDRGTYVAERVAGIASVAWATAYAQAVERALGVEPPQRTQRWRAVYAELERIANHLDVIAKEAETTALFVGQARFQIHKENVLRLQAAFTGSRFARGAIVPGGVRENGRVDLDELLAVLDAFERDLRRDRRLFLRTASMTDRLIGTGHLDRALLEAYGAVGPLARGSGLATDARHERPYGDYRRLGLEVMTAEEGDAMARIDVRFDEIAESTRILRQATDQLRRRDGELRIPLPAGAGSAFGWSEAPQGELVVWVEVADGHLENVHIAAPDLRNWAIFDHAFPADVLTDFAFIEHSFGLTPAGADR
ncbi:MAG: NADH-quinone oxidoreductase subunit D [Pseudonocardiales bacterium]|nr:MAG: NADH-quinone oxidoreductase subunit D [Pseudonocardiales bacterium]